MATDTKLPEFSLFGGPLQSLGSRLGLVKGETNTFRLGLALGLMSWGVLVLLTLLQGLGHRIFLLRFIGVHVRLLAAIPLFFACETWVGPRMAEFVRMIVRSELVQGSDLPVLSSLIRKIDRINDSWLVEGSFILLTVAMPIIEPLAKIPGSSANWLVILNQAGGNLTWAHAWYLGFCLPVFRFLMFRWLWHLGLWWYFLWRMEKLKLQLVPTHSDGMGGLGYLEVVHEHFIPLVLAAAALFSASMAEELYAKTMAFEALYGLIPGVLFLSGVLFIGTLFIFSRKLWICRRNGLNEYMAMASRYVQAFDRKWIRDEKATGESQLGTADMQSLADLTNSVNVVREMQWIPGSRRLVLGLAAAVILPMLPLLLLKYPVGDLAAKLFQALTGL